MSDFSEFDRCMLRFAMGQARLAAREGEIPVGASIARGGRLLCAARNTRERLSDPTGHAEINVLRLAARLLGDWRLSDCTMYVTLEPCPMCAGAIVQARLQRLVFGAYDAQAGCCGSVYRLTEDPAFSHFCIAQGGLLQAECEALMRGAPYAKKRRDAPSTRPFDEPSI